MNSWRRNIILPGLILIAVAFSYSVWKKEQILANGESLLLKLAPVDPRSLLQGDYMILNYAMPDDLLKQMAEQKQGEVVYTKDDKQVAQFARLDDNRLPLQQGERTLSYRSSGATRVYLGANSFFFEEGQAERFTDAAYGEVKVTNDGGTVLIGLRDREFKLLGLTSGLEKRVKASK